MSNSRLSLGKKNPAPINLNTNNNNNNNNTLAPISANELSGGANDTFFRSGQQSPKPRGRKKVAVPSTNKNANAGTPGTTNRLLDDNVGRGSRLTPIQTGNLNNNANNQGGNNISPSRGQRSPLRRHLSGITIEMDFHFV